MIKPIELTYEQARVEWCGQGYGPKQVQNFNGREKLNKKERPVLTGVIIGVGIAIIITVLTL
jgi:hypothetical protein